MLVQLLKELFGLRMRQLLVDELLSNVSLFIELTHCVLQLGPDSDEFFLLESVVLGQSLR